MDQRPLPFAWHLTRTRVPLAYGLDAVGWHVVDAEGQILARAATWTELQVMLASQAPTSRLVWIEVVA